MQQNFKQINNKNKIIKKKYSYVYKLFIIFGTSLDFFLYICIFVGLLTY